MNVTILFIWTVVAVSSGASGRAYHDWRVLSEFSSPAACHKAIATLGLKPDAARCVPK